ncbi:SpoIIE family protein phosphatase [Streptomyces sp. NPDC058525]|uniref:SpoIIE family protein phosphatase n=1 Tax=unclassified Streptomyces TaxID=2593676 RepID=UPI00364A5220
MEGRLQRHHPAHGPHPTHEPHRRLRRPRHADGRSCLGQLRPPRTASHPRPPRGRRRAPARCAAPLGISPRHAPRVRSTVHHAQLEPGDRILIHADGVTEARWETGEQFGEERLIYTVVRATAAGEAAPEALRRLVRAILDHHHGHLKDDATILLAEWHPPSEEALGERRGG